MNSTDTEKNLLVIKASAGSGKTYRLAMEYIKHLLFATGNGQTVPRRGGGSQPVNAHRQILAITFTKKATGEMKDRIIQELHVLSQPDGKSKYLKEYMALSGLGEERVRELARIALQELLFDYSNFNVSTIDSFFQGILRNFARELDRDFSYELEIDEEYAMRVAVHSFLLSLGRRDKGGQMEKWVKEYQRGMINDDPSKRKWKFFEDGGDLLTFAKQMTSETFRSRMDDIRGYLGKTDQDGVYRYDFGQVRGFLKQVRSIVDGLEQQITDDLEQLKVLAASEADKLSASKSLKKWLNKANDTGKLPMLTATLASVDASTIDGQYLKGKNPSPQSKSQMVQLINQHFRAVNKLSLFKHMAKKIGLLGMLAAIDRHLENYRHESNCILIGDTNELIGAVLESGSEFVYERVGTTVSHFMIDEFQDTSAKQYANFKTLIDESLASGNFNMLIGDAKQSIYRFRNADPTVFRELVEQDFAAHINRGGQTKSTNYRSSRTIVEFNNRLFVNMRENYRNFPAVVTAYGDVEQDLPADVDEAKVPGWVRVYLDNYKGLLALPVVAEAAAAVGGQAQDAGQDNEGDQGGGNSDDAMFAVLPGYLLELHERFGWGQIGILTDRRSEGKKVVECILNYNKHVAADKQINVVSDESLLLNNSPVICRIIAMLRFIDICFFSANDDDADADRATDDKGRYRDSMLKRLGNDQRMHAVLDAFIRESAQTPDGDIGKVLASCFNQHDQHAAAGNDAASYEQLVNEMLPGEGELTTLVSIVENIIARFRADERHRAVVDNEAAFVLAFQDQVKAFCAKRNGGTVREFLNYWDTKKEKLSVPGTDGGDAVSIMTIHKSKGLEFDCVVIPFAKWDLKDNTREKSYWVPREAVVDIMRQHGLDVDEKLVPPLVCADKKSLVSMLEAGQLTDDNGVAGPAKAFVLKQRSDTIIDNLNKTYVAFTRAGTELHIFAPYKAPKNAKLGDLYAAVPHLLADFAVGAMAPVAGFEGSWYEMGSPSSRDDMAAKRGAPARSEVCQKPLDIYRAAKMPEQIIVKVENATGSNIAVGKRLHALLSRIGDRNGVERVITEAVKHGAITSGADDPCSIDRVTEHVVRPIMDANGMIGKWFDPDNKVYSERTVTTANRSADGGSDIENLRPDRIVRRPDGTWIVIDYKSGELIVKDKENPGQEHRLHLKHCKQVRGYIERLRATGLVPAGTPVVGRIWYIKYGIVLDEHGNRLL